MVPRIPLWELATVHDQETTLLREVYELGLYSVKDVIDFFRRPECREAIRKANPVELFLCEPLMNDGNMGTVRVRSMEEWLEDSDHWRAATVVDIEELEDFLPRTRFAISGHRGDLATDLFRNDSGDWTHLAVDSFQHFLVVPARMPEHETEKVDTKCSCGGEATIWPLGRHIYAIERGCNCGQPSFEIVNDTYGTSEGNEDGESDCESGCNHDCGPDGECCGECPLSNGTADPNDNEPDNNDSWHLQFGGANDDYT